MSHEIFADGISAVHVTGNMVRINLMTLQPHLKSDNGQPVVEVNKRLIMPLDGFVQSLATQQDIVKQLVAAGVLQQSPAFPTESQTTDNSNGINAYGCRVRRKLIEVLNRRSQKKSLTWEGFAKLEERFPLARARIYVNIYG